MKRIILILMLLHFLGFSYGQEDDTQIAGCSIKMAGNLWQGNQPLFQ